MNIRKKWAVAAAVLACGFAFAGTAGATVIQMHFDSIANADGYSDGGQYVNDYYNGGCTSAYPGNTRGNDCSGPNYGISWDGALAGDTSNALNAFWNGTTGEPSPNNVIGFLDTTHAIMNMAAGFTNGFSFWYAAPGSAGSVTVYDGLNGTGNVLATLVLPTNGNYCSANFYASCWTPLGVSFMGIAKSVSFAGSANGILFDNITLGAANPIPEPAALGMFGLGLLLLGGFVGLRKRYS